MSFLDTNCVILSNDILTFVIISYVLFIGSSLKPSANIGPTRPITSTAR